MEARLLLDTFAYSRLCAGHPRVLDLLASADVVYVPTIVLGELYAGFAVGQWERQNRSALAELLAEPFVEVLPVSASVADRYGKIFAQLRRDGTPIPINDLWIAALALDAGAALLTFDRHFARVAGLDCTILEP